MRTLLRSKTKILGAIFILTGLAPVCFRHFHPEPELPIIALGVWMLWKNGGHGLRSAERGA
jgi:hypothetical protein